MLIKYNTATCDPQRHYLWQHVTLKDIIYGNMWPSKTLSMATCGPQRHYPWQHVTLKDIIYGNMWPSKTLSMATCDPQRHYLWQHVALNDIIYGSQWLASTSKTLPTNTVMWTARFKQRRNKLVSVMQWVNFPSSLWSCNCSFNFLFKPIDALD